MKATVKSFKSYCGGSLAELVSPVKRQMGADVDEFFNELHDVSKSYCGAAAGFSGFIYYSETVSFWRKNRSKIMSYANELADDLGENVLTMVCNFNCFKDGFYSTEEIAKALYGRYNKDLTTIYNYMAWFALEEVAHRFADYEYENRWQ